MAITPVAIQGFQISSTISQGTYVLINGVEGKQIKILSYNVTSTAGTITLQDDTGAVILFSLSGSCGAGTSQLTILPTGAGLQAIVTDTTTVNAYFVGFLS